MDIKMLGEGSDFFDQDGYKFLRCYNNESIGFTVVMNLRANISAKPYYVGTETKYGELLPKNKFYATKAKVSKIKTIDEMDVPDKFFDEFQCYAYDGTKLKKFFPGQTIRNMNFYRDSEDIYEDIVDVRLENQSLEEQLEDFKECSRALKKYDNFWRSDRAKYLKLQEHCDNEYNRVLDKINNKK